MPRMTSGWGHGLLGVIIFSGSLPATRVAVGGFTPLFLTSARAVIAALLGAALLLVLVLLPQAVRKVIAPLAGNALELVKTTSIGALVAMPELLRSARVAQEQTYNPTPLMAAALIYFVLLWPLSRWVAVLERRALSRG